MAQLPKIQRPFKISVLNPQRFNVPRHKNTHRDLFKHKTRACSTQLSNNNQRLRNSKIRCLLAYLPGLQRGFPNRGLSGLGGLGLVIMGTRVPFTTALKFIVLDFSLFPLPVYFTSLLTLICNDWGD